MAQMKANQKLLEIHKNAIKSELEKESADANYESLQCTLNRSKNALLRDEKYLHDAFEETWNNTMEFIDESRKFHEERGIFSSWWKNQMHNLQLNSEYNQSNTGIEMQSEIADLKTNIAKEKSSIEISTKRESEISTLLLVCEDKITELIKEEHDLRQEPFGPEFISLKAKIQKRKNMCMQLRALDFPHHLSLQFPGDYEQTEPKQLETEPTLPHSTCISSVNSHSKQGHSARKFFKKREKITVAVHRQYAISNSGRLNHPKTPIEREGEEGNLENDH